MDEGFLKLPPEIRNMIYDLILPTPKDPKLLFIGKRSNLARMEQYSPEFSVQRARSVYRNLYLTCKQIHCELPSVQYLLKSGSIIPTFNLICTVYNDFKREKYPEWVSRALKDALYLRINAQLKVDPKCRLLSGKILDFDQAYFLMQYGEVFALSDLNKDAQLAISSLLCSFLDAKEIPKGKVLQVQSECQVGCFIDDFRGLLDSIMAQSKLMDDKICALDRIELLSEHMPLVEERTVWLNNNLDSIKRRYALLEGKKRSN